MDLPKSTRFDPNAWRKQGRGPTYLLRLEKYMNVGKKLVVRYNSRGQPVGKVATLLSSYTGLLARTIVPITYDRWTNVPSNLKEEIWDHVKVFIHPLTFGSKLCSIGRLICFLNRTCIDVVQDGGKYEDPYSVFCLY